MWKRLRDWWSAAGDAHRLLQLDDRLLADIGLERAGLRKRVMGQGETQGSEIRIEATGSIPGACTSA